MRKAFEMIQGIALSENRDVYSLLKSLCPCLYSCIIVVKIFVYSEYFSLLCKLFCCLQFDAFGWSVLQTLIALL